MNRLMLYRLLRKNTTLSYKRSPIFEQNKWAKAITYFGAGMMALYMILYGSIIAMILFNPFNILQDTLYFRFQSDCGEAVICFTCIAAECVVG